VNPTQRGFHFPQQGGLAIHVSNRQISFRSVLDLVHFIRAPPNCDTVPLSQYMNQLGLFSFKHPLEFRHIGVLPMHRFVWLRASHATAFARDAPELKVARQER
jgi:hypothetical protein